MSVLQRPSTRSGSSLVLILSVCAALAGCGSLDGASQRLSGWITPYKPDVIQGNFVSKEQVAALQPGMSRAQVREVLGTPLVASLFHADRWDYVFTMKRQKAEPQSLKLTVFFKGDALERFEGDVMPTEAEFAATLDSGRKIGKVPVLEASEESLKKFQLSTPASAPEPVAAPAVSYPPLETPAR
jgi:outer membrane protein assembly factor BamE